MYNKTNLQWGSSTLSGDAYAQHRQGVNITSIQKNPDSSTLLIIVLKLNLFLERNKGGKLPRNFHCLLMLSYVKV